MKKIKTTKKGRTSKKITRDQYAELLKRPETLVGAAVIGAIIVIALLSTFFNPIATTGSSSRFTQKESIILDSQNAAASSSAARSTTPSASVASMATQSATATLSATRAPSASPTPSATPAAALRVKVKKDQTFWEIAKRYCGSHQYADTLARNNGYKSVSKLREGDVITVTCAQ